MCNHDRPLLQRLHGYMPPPQAAQVWPEVRQESVRAQVQTSKGGEEMKSRLPKWIRVPNFALYWAGSVTSTWYTVDRFMLIDNPGAYTWTARGWRRVAK
jgi:hypothetical protein